MAAKSFTVNATGTTTGQALDDASTAVIVRGNLKGGTLQIEASNADANYVLVTSVDGLAADGVSTLQLPAGWYVRTRFIGAEAPSATVIVE